MTPDHRTRGRALAPLIAAWLLLATWACAPPPGDRAGSAESRPAAAPTVRPSVTSPGVITTAYVT
ncbi:MAG: hypothetical protein ACRDP8_14145 [Actinopolymorphaceae bacterium]